MFATNVKSIILNRFLVIFHILFRNSDEEFGYLVNKQEFRMILILSVKKTLWQADTLGSQAIPRSGTLKNVDNADQVSGLG